MIAYHNYYYRTNYYAFIHKMNNLTAYQLHYAGWFRFSVQSLEIQLKMSVVQLFAVFCAAYLTRS